MGKIITTLSRIIVGGLFIFSGIIKANDPLGFAYKLEEYFTVFQLDFLKEFTVLLSITICVVEVILGVLLLLGYLKKLTLNLILLMIVFFTFLTFYSAYFDVVTDCGCFGDFLKLTPWESFFKDVILLVFILILYFNKRHINPLFNHSLNRPLSLTALVLAILFPIYTYAYLPVWDFRPYKVGNDIEELMTIPEGAPRDEYKTSFIYKNKETGEEKEFTVENLPSGDNWEFVDRKNELIQKGYEPPIHDFSISDLDGSSLTQKFLDQKTYRLLLVQYDLNKTDESVQEEIIKLANKTAATEKIYFWALTASGPEKIESYMAKHEIQYPYYFTDATTLKTIIRSNPGLLLLKNNKIIKKWPANRIPSFEDVMSKVK